MRLLRLAPTLTVLVMLGPVAAGLLATVLPAFGILPGLQAAEPGLDAWRRLLAMPGLGQGMWLAAWTGFAAGALAFAIAVLFAAAWHGTATFDRLMRVLSPLLSVPHVTVAFGLAFLLAPSGWLVRLLTGYDRPPDWLTVNDPAGLGLILALTVKELPFLLLMLLAALNQVPAARYQAVARTLGYGRMLAWLHAVFPLVYPQLRLPVFAVLAYSLSVVDVALVIGPSLPPTLAVQLMRWFADPDIALRLVGAAGALLQVGLVIAGIGFWLLLERVVGVLCRMVRRRGRRGAADRPARLAALLPTLSVIGLAGLGLLAMALWSVAQSWRFPAVLPQDWSMRAWGRVEGTALWPTVTLALAASLLATALVLACLEHEAATQRRPARAVLWLLYLPLLVPQIGFLFGLQVLLVRLDLDGSWLAVLWSHLIFVLPYVFLSLAEPYRAWDPRYGRSALCLGASPFRVWLAVKLPMLLRPVLIAAAIGLAVSVAQYLPTLFAGAGRVVTLTTEAVTLSAGGDRRLIGAYAVLQMLLPLAGFALAQALPAWLYRDRRGLRVGR
jgi:putative thiamine transport system permease protein